MKKNRILLFDTSNFENFPIGGQLTSIRNFLIGLSQNELDNFFLIGVCNRLDELGKVKKIKLGSDKFVSFMPVVYLDLDYSNVKKSIRLQYLKGLIKYRHKIKNLKGNIFYFHTPEAYVMSFIYGNHIKKIIFSHGSYFGMTNHIRFFKKFKLFHMFFERYLKYIIKKADLILTLDNDSLIEYKKYNSNVLIVDNSIEIPNLADNKVFQNRLLYVGRISKVKRVDEIIRALKFLPDSYTLTVVGDGEEYLNMKKIVESTQLEERVVFEGAKNPLELKDFYTRHDILILNSIHEGIPMVTLEAQSYKLPVVTTNVGGISRILNAGKDCLYTDGTAQSISSRILEISKNYQVYSKNAYENSKGYSNIKISKKIMKYIGECC